ncbi:MAG: carboxypeptidase M32, partial [Crenarchaeota archaeon]|nr:carboxypeptidase M32 [Thermoproteota archaeon]
MLNIHNQYNIGSQLDKAEIEVNSMGIDVKSAYRKLLEKNKDVIVLGNAQCIINWDMETMMPPSGVNMRSEQLSLLSRINHEMSTAPEIRNLLDELTKNQDNSLNEVEKRNVELIKKNYEEQTKLPSKLVSEISRQQAITVNTWKKAKAAKNFAAFRPELEKLVELDKEAANILMDVKQTKTPYDAFIDIYEPKMTSDEITKIFSELEKDLKIILSKIMATKPQSDVILSNQIIPIDKQRTIAQLLTETVGYDIISPNAAGRLDETEHPFTTGYYDDVRITTHYHPKNFTSSVFSILHEAGHALYEQGLPQEWKYQPVGAPASMGIHESQSRLHENIIGRSTHFWTSLLPKIKEIIKPSLADIELEKFVSLINTVKPSKIRIESDEVTYSLHIIIRFQIEKDLFAGKIKVNELPVVWNQKYEEVLGVQIENDSEGVMQDTHWASGLFGYFPSYA